MAQHLNQNLGEEMDDDEAFSRAAEQTAESVNQSEQSSCDVEEIH